MYLKMIEELEKRIDLALKNGEFNVADELEDLLKWAKANL